MDGRRLLVRPLKAVRECTQSITRARIFHIQAIKATINYHSTQSKTRKPDPRCASFLLCNRDAPMQALQETVPGSADDPL